MQEKLCINCNEIKPINQFYKKRKQCKSCVIERQKQLNKLKKDRESSNKNIGVVVDMKTDENKINPEIKKVKENKEIKKEIKENKENKEIKKEVKENKEIAQDFNLSTLKIGISYGLRLFFKVIASRAGSHWLLTNDEVEALTDAIAKVLSKLTYATQISENMDMINLGITIFAVFAPKVEKSIQIKKDKKGGKKVENIPRPTEQYKSNNRIDKKLERNDSPKPNVEEQIKNISNQSIKSNSELEQFNEALLDDII